MRKAIIVAAVFFSILTYTTTACNQIKYTNMNFEQFREYIKDTTVTVLDVRTSEEYNQGHIENAINIDFYSKTFTQEVENTIDKNKKIALYCRSGKRSASAAEKLSPLGYNIVNLNGGYLEWTAKEKQENQSL